MQPGARPVEPAQGVVEQLQRAEADRALILAHVGRQTVSDRLDSGENRGAVDVCDDFDKGHLVGLDPQLELVHNLN